MADIIIHCNFPGGNIIVDSIFEHKVKLRQDLRDTMQWWFYWSFCIENAQGREIEFEFTDKEVIGNWGPAVSKDGTNWAWAGEDIILNRQMFRYNFAEDDEKIYFSFSLPYQLKDFESFFNRYKDHKLLKRTVLTRSEKGREVPLLQLGNFNANKHIFFTCRHHACESTAAYLVEGAMSSMLEQEESFILNNYLIHIVPFVDLDGVEDGDQGKAREPHDHNRDYTEMPIYKSTAAIMKYAKELHPIIAIDFHSPYKWGGKNNYPFFVKQLPPIKEEIEKLGRILADVSRMNKNNDRIIFDPTHDMEMGQSWNQPDTPNCSTFFRERAARISCTFEFPYFGIGSMRFTQKNCREFGADFMKALELYLIQC